MPLPPLASRMLQSSMGGVSQPQLRIKNIWGALDTVTQTSRGTPDIPDLTDRKNEARGVRYLFVVTQPANGRGC